MVTKSRVAWVAAVLAVAGLGGWAYHHFLWWKKFAVVEPGVLYRSGMLRDGQLRQAVAQHHIKTVFSFTHSYSDREQRTCAELGVKRLVCHLPGDGVGPDDPYLRFLQVMADPANHPVLVHCSAGTQRTGGAVALYRVVYQDWPMDQARAEMLAMGNKGRATLLQQLDRLAARMTPAP